MRRWNFQGNVLVTNFSDEMTPATLAQLFDDYGMVLGVQIKEVVSNAGTRLLGVVALAPDKAADEAIDGLQGHAVEGRKLKLKRCVPKPKPAPKGDAAPRRPRAPVGPPPDDFLPIPRPMALRGAHMAPHISSHGPASHGPANHGPANHGPANHGPASHGPASHGPASHGPAVHSAVSHNSAQHIGEPWLPAAPAPRREPLVVETRTPRKVIVEYKAGAGRIARPAPARPKSDAE